MFTKIARKEEGFTLIELLVVVAIIALLTAFAVPRLFEAINKSKGAQGNSDMQTISGALERYYMDKSAYPKTTTTGDLTGTYLKATTTYLNGFGRGYIYITDKDDTGAFYILIDPKNQPTGTGAAKLTVKCASNEDTGPAYIVSETFTPLKATNITGADVKAGPCTVKSDKDGYEAPVLITN